MSVFYADGVTQVRPGDFVKARAWVNLFRRLPARVVYVPGLSARHSGMEYGGMSWVGIRFAGGTVFAVWVDPETHVLKKGVDFQARGDEVNPLEPAIELDG